jgi:hypothetical protein
MFCERPKSSGRNTSSVITASMMLSPRFSTMLEKFCVSSWTRWDAPSMSRIFCQLAM